jgi:hypothetical protein
VSVRVFKLVLLFLLLATVLYPTLETLDGWDGAGPGNDTELGLLGVAIGTGLVLCLSRLLTTGARKLVPILRGTKIFAIPLSPAVFLIPTLFLCESPPPLLRI